MSNSISNQLLAQFYGMASDDPFLMLLTIDHEDFDEEIRLVNNTENQISRGKEFLSFPMNIRLPGDDGENLREVSIEFDNVSLYLIGELRSVTTPMDVKLEMILASDPDTVQLSLEELKLKNVVYDKQKVSAKLFMDSFLNVEMTSEKYTPTIYPGLF